jgi:hypothetical protein
LIDEQNSVLTNSTQEFNPMIVAPPQIYHVKNKKDKEANSKEQK